MTEGSRSSERLREAALYAVAAVVSLVAAFFLLQLWKADLRVPFDHGGDALSFALVVKSVLDNGWYLHIPQVGAPGGLEMHDFPFADQLHLLLIKGMSLFSGDWALLFNVYFLLGFPLITVAALSVLRHYRVRYDFALMASVLYAFLPSRLLKGEGHIFMDVFFQVPLAILVVLWVCEERPPLPRDRRFVIAAVICVLTALMGLYYAFFTAFLLTAGGAWASVRRRSWRNVVAGGLLAATIGATLGLAGLPTLIYRARHGANRQVATREPFEAEHYALKPMQLVLPVDGHRIPALARFKQEYTDRTPFVGEGGTSLGVIGALGFLALLGTMLLGPRKDQRSDLVRALAVLNLMMLLLGTVGGLGSLFAHLVTPQIRTYARVNVVIGFLALFAVALLLERLAARRPRLAGALVPVLFGVGLLDQASGRVIRNYAANKAIYEGEAELVRRIEAALPAGAMIFQLPKQSFPEAAAVKRADGYDTIRPYLHSRGLRWSQPAMRGRAGDAWLAAVAGREPGKLVQMVADAGFEGILVDRDGYGDSGAEIEQALGKVLGNEPLVGGSGRYAFFRLAQKPLSPEERERRRYQAMHPLLVSWSSGFSGVETAPGRTWRWCSANGEVTIENTTSADRRLTIRATLVAANPPARLDLSGDLVTEQIEIPPEGAPFSRSFTVHPGKHLIRFHSDGQPAEAPGDPRTLVWRAEGPIVEEAPAD